MKKGDRLWDNDLGTYREATRREAFSYNWYRFWTDFWGSGCCFTIMVILIFAVVVGLIFGLSFLSGYKSCQVFADKNNIHFVYNIWYGCMVNYNGHWINPDMFVQLLK